MYIWAVHNIRHHYAVHLLIFSGLVWFHVLSFLVLGSLNAIIYSTTIPFYGYTSFAFGVDFTIFMC